MLVKARIKYMIDEACLVGYRWGRAEADLHMKPLAEGGLRSRTAAPKGGRASGARRREIAEATWKPRALQLAREARKADPTGTREQIVGAMKNRETKEIRLPSERILMPFLREKEDFRRTERQNEKRREGPQKEEVKALHCLDAREPRGEKRPRETPSIARRS